MNQKSLEQLERAKKIAIFSGLTDERLNEILTHAKIHNCKKKRIIIFGRRRSRKILHNFRWRNEACG